MITDNQPFSRYQCSEIDESLEDIQEEDSYYQHSELAWSQPLLERYLSNEYSIFKQSQLELASICQIKNRSELEEKRKCFKAYFESQSSRKMKAIRSVETEEVAQFCSQFTTNLSKVPSYSIIYLCITEVDDNRFNLVMRNGKGQCLAYLQNQRKIKKLPKILKILKRIKKPVLAFIIDSTFQKETNIVQIEKISDSVAQFVYIFENSKNLEVKIDGSHLRSQSLAGKDSQCSIQVSGNQLIITSPNLSSATESDEIDLIINKIKLLEHQDQQALKSIRSLRSRNKKNLQLDLLFINVFRVCHCTPSKAILIIQDLFMKQQEAYLRKQEEQRQKSFYRNLNKDPDSHYPEKMIDSKSCKRCQYAYKKKFKKTNVKCEGCSVYFKRDIPLCPQCFAQFHEQFKFYSSRLRTNRLNKQMRYLHNKKKRSHSQEPEARSQKQISVIKTDPPEKKNFHLDSQSQDPCNSITEKVEKMDVLLTETFSMVKKLSQINSDDVAGIFLGAYVGTCLSKMKKISQNFPQFNEGVTKIGSKVMKLVEAEQKTEMRYISPQNIFKRLKQLQKKNQIQDELAIKSQQSIS